jgi:hypothetical protein
MAKPWFVDHLLGIEQAYNGVEAGEGASAPSDRMSGTKVGDDTVSVIFTGVPVGVAISPDDTRAYVAPPAARSLD